MATRRDQLQSYQFLTRRVIAALVTRELDPPQSPLRRGVGAVFAGAMVAVLVAAGFGGYGLVTRIGGDDWRTEGAVVVERESGATYVHLADRLHPTLNYASAVLAAGVPDPAVHRVARAALAEVPRGVTLGIPGAPDSLPPAGDLIGLPWTVCLRDDGTSDPETDLVVGAVPAGARALAADGLLVRDPDGGTHLVWQGGRHRLRDPGLVVAALFGAVAAPAPTGAAWLAAVPASADIGPFEVEGQGEPSRAVAGRVVGELLVASTGSGPQHYLVLADGLAALTPLQAAIAAAQAPAPPAPVPIGEAAASPAVPAPGLPAGAAPAPDTPPALVTAAAGEPVCAATGTAAGRPEVHIGGSIEGLGQGIPTGGVGPAGNALADRVHLSPGRGALVSAAGFLHLVTDQGRRFPVPSPEVLALLGYPPDRVVEVPAALVALVPAGPALDPGQAVRPVPPGATTGSG